MSPHVTFLHVIRLKCFQCYVSSATTREIKSRDRNVVIPGAVDAPTSQRVPRNAGQMPPKLRRIASPPAATPTPAFLHLHLLDNRGLLHAHFVSGTYNVHSNHIWSIAEYFYVKRHAGIVIRDTRAELSQTIRRARYQQRIAPSYAPADNTTALRHNKHTGLRPIKAKAVAQQIF